MKADLWIAALFGWPAVAAAVLLALAGAMTLRLPLAVIGALLVFPSALYLYGTPRYGWSGLALPLLLAAAAWAIHRARRNVALGCVAAAAAFAASVASVVFFQ